MRRPWPSGVLPNTNDGRYTVWRRDCVSAIVQFLGFAREEMTLEREGQANCETVCCSKGGLETVQCVIRGAVSTFNHFNQQALLLLSAVDDSPGPA